jgi:hypothetical protein
MTPFTAAMVADGEFDLAGVDPSDEETVLAAWQYLVDTGMAWQLQGRVGRQAAAMLAAGVLTRPQENAA